MDEKYPIHQPYEKIDFSERRIKAVEKGKADVISVHLKLLKAALRLE